MTRGSHNYALANRWLSQILGSNTLTAGSFNCVLGLNVIGVYLCMNTLHAASVMWRLCSSAGVFH